jgi:hypothetical protein
MKITSLAILTTMFTVSLVDTVQGQDAISKAESLNAAVHVTRNDVNVNALRHFVKNFNDAGVANWYATPDLVVVLFTVREVDYRVDYRRRNGNWIETFRTYNEAKMSPDLKQSVKSSYYDYTIFQVQEIEQPLHPVNYIVHLSGKSKLINLRIYNGLIEEEQNFREAE